MLGKDIEEANTVVENSSRYMTCMCCFCISNANVGIVENCGKFYYAAEPGCGCICPLCCGLRGYVPLSLQTANITVVTKTRDNALVHIETRIHYKVVEEKAIDAFYRFSNPSEQLGSFTASIVRGEVPKYTLDELFLMSDEIKKVVQNDLAERLLEYGFSLESVLLTRIDPTGEVKMAISQTLVNAYLRTAAEHDAELKKIKQITDAEADFEEKRLSGVGLALERAAIMKGMQSGVEEFVRNVPGTHPRDVMNLLLLNQYFNAVKDIGASRNNNLFLLPDTGVNILPELLASQINDPAKMK